VESGKLASVILITRKKQENIDHHTTPGEERTEFFIFCYKIPYNNYLYKLV
tara:strand:+ start:133 stop:285 length:153 start_codon:yes stop_codon:yes gene_type:complete